MSLEHAPGPGGGSGGSFKSTDNGPRDIVSRFMRLGAGSFAAVYTTEGGPLRAIKVVHNELHLPDLQAELDSLRRIHAAYSNDELLFKVPTPGQINPSLHAYAAVIRVATTGLPNHPIYTMRRLLPVPMHLATQIVEKFFPAEHRAKCRYAFFICRLYFGPLRPSRTGRFFNHQNFPLTPAMLETLGLPVEHIAEGMGRLLSTMHHKAQCDARDVEFVLGGSSDDDDEPEYWCIDFNQVREWSSTDDLLKSFKDNDPYFPHPGMAYWDTFKKGYLAAAPVNAAHDFIAAIEVWAAAQAEAAPSAAAAPP